MKNVSHVFKNQNGLALIPVMLVSLILVSLLSVWMIQFSNKSAISSQDWVQKENFRIGTELAKQVAEAHELYRQQGSTCNTSTHVLLNGLFCFKKGATGSGVEQGNSVFTAACAKSPLAGSQAVCIRTTQNKFDAPSKSTTLYAAYIPRPKFNIFISTANALPANAPNIPSFSGNVATATTTCTGMNYPYGSLCHACASSGSVTCFQVQYCSVMDPTCASTPALTMGLMVKTD